MAISTPYLDAHPEYSDMLNRKSEARHLSFAEEYVSLTISDEGRVVWSWKEVPYWETDVWDRTAHFPYRGRKTLRIDLIYTRIKNGSIFRTIIALNPPKFYWQKSGIAQVSLKALMVQYPTALRNARSRVLRQIKPPKREGRRSPKSSVRPSPETQMTPFLNVTEIVTSGGTYSLNVSPTSTLLKERTWTGVRTPNFKNLKKSQYPVNPHTVSIQVVAANGPCFDLNDQRGKGNPPSPAFSMFLTTHTAHYSPPAGPAHLPLALNKAIKNLAASAGSGAKAQLGEGLGQFGKTVTMIGSSASKIAKSINNLKKGNIPGAINSLWTSNQKPRFRRGGPSFGQNLASNWLELQYGWKPLLGEVQASVTALNAFANEVGAIQQVSASASAKKRTRTVFPAWDANSTVVGVTDVDLETRAKITLRFRMHSPLKTYLSQVGLTNPLSLAWELLPFSFVGDWFLPIGPYLESLSSWDGLTFLDGCTTSFTRQIVASSIGGSNTSPLNSTITKTTSSVYRREWIILNRGKLTEFPQQSFPQLKMGIDNTTGGMTHALNAVALVVSIFGSRGR